MRLKKTIESKRKRAMNDHIDYVRQQLIEFVNSQSSQPSKAAREVRKSQLIAANGDKA